MTPEQYDRWLDFAVRMARNGWENMTEARRGRLESSVRSFISYQDRLGDVSDIKSWDDSPAYICDRVTEWFSSEHEHYWTDRRGDQIEFGNKFYTQLRCCICAGLDIAAEPSAGVMGFTVADLQRMYDGVIPEWISGQFNTDLNQLETNERILL